MVQVAPESVDRQTPPSHPNQMFVGSAFETRTAWTSAWSDDWLDAKVPPPSVDFRKT